MFLSIPVVPFVSVTRSEWIPPEMNGRELDQFFHFDMPPYLPILLLSINIAVIVNKCNNGSFFAALGAITIKSVKEISLQKTCVTLGSI